MCAVLLSSVNGRDDGKRVVTPPKSVSQSVVSLGAVVQTASSSRPTSGRSRQPASLQLSSVEVGPAGSPAAQPVLSYSETPRDTVMTARLHSKTVYDREATEQSVSRTSSKPSSETADTSSRSQVVTRDEDMSHAGVVSHNSALQSSVKATMTHTSPGLSTATQSSSHDKPKPSRLAVYNTSSLSALFVIN